MEIIRETANKHGFEFEQPNRHVATIRDGKDWSKAWVNFTIWENPSWDLETRTVTVALKITAATARMGGNQTVEDLRKAADAITRAANLVEELEDMNLAYTASIDKEA